MAEQRAVAACTSMITAGSVRGKCSVPQAVQSITCPALRGSQALPQTPQKRCRCASASGRAHGRGSTHLARQGRPTARRSVNSPMSGGSSGSGSSAALMSTANSGTLVLQAEERPGAALHRARAAAPPRR